MRILWLIPARSGSQSVPHKNIRQLAGLPLLGYRVRSVLALSAPENIWVSTDSAEYAEIAKQYGATIPFLRPAALATDEASSVDVVLHAMDFADEKKLQFDLIGLMEPTSPFIYVEDLLKAVEQLYDDEQADAIVAVKRVRPNSYFVQDQSRYLSELAERLELLKNHQRQQFNDQVTPSGGFYISKWNSFRQKKTFYTPYTIAYLIPPECDLEIDEPADWTWAEFLLDKKIIDVNKLFFKNV